MTLIPPGARAVPPKLQSGTGLEAVTGGAVAPANRWHPLRKILGLPIVVKLLWMSSGGQVHVGRSEPALIKLMYHAEISFRFSRARPKLIQV